MSTVMRGALTISLAALLPAPAQSAGGRMGPQSSANLQISVSVLPRFDVRVEPPPAKNDASSRLGEAVLTASSNAPALRYATISYPLEGTGADDTQLVLIVPD